MSSNSRNDRVKRKVPSKVPEVENLTINLACKTVQENTETLQNQVKAAVESKPHSMEKLNQIIQGLNSLVLLSKISEEEFKCESENTTLIPPPPANKKIQHQVLFSTKKRNKKT